VYVDSKDDGVESADDDAVVESSEPIGTISSFSKLSFSRGESKDWYGRVVSGHHELPAVGFASGNDSSERLATLTFDNIEQMKGFIFSWTR